MTKTVILSAGHSNTQGRDQGATGNGYIEGHLAVEFRALLAQELQKLGIRPILDGNNSILADSLNFFKKLIKTNNSILIDIHWNSGPATAEGTEVFVPNNYTKEEYNLAKDIAELISKMLATPTRSLDGVKTEFESHHKKLGWMTLSGTNVLIEMCFITNYSEMENYQSAKFAIAKSLARLIFNYANGLSSQAHLEQTIHTVKIGDNLYNLSRVFGVSVDKIQKANNLHSTVIQPGMILIIPKP